MSKTARPRFEAAQFLDRYGVAVVLLFVCIFTFAAVGDSLAGRVVFVAIQGFTLIVILFASRVPAKLTRWAVVFVGVALVATAASSAIGPEAATVAAAVAAFALSVGGPVAIVWRLVEVPKIDLRMIAGAICIYLLLGLLFALVYTGLNAIDAPFFVQKGGAEAVDFVYFSFVTLTTVGYGDLTARTNLGRMLAITEALFGQLYLVSALAFMVGNIGRERTRVRRRPDVTDETDGGVSGGRGSRR